MTHTIKLISIEKSHYIHHDEMVKYEQNISYYDLLVQHYSSFNSGYFVICNIRKSEYFHKLKFWLKTKTIYGCNKNVLNDTIYLRTVSCMEDIKFFKKNKILTPIKIIKTEHDETIDYDLVVCEKKYYSTVKQSIPMLECGICCEHNKEYYSDNYFPCKHDIENKICCDCIQIISKRKNDCPYCRQPSMYNYDETFA